MKRILGFMLVIALFFALPGCKSEGAAKETLMPADNQTKKTGPKKILILCSRKSKKTIGNTSTAF